MRDWPGWPEEVAERYRQRGYWAGETFSAALHRWAARSGERTALIDGERRISYAELLDQSLRLAQGLHGLGVRPRDRVIVQLPNMAEFVVAWFALQHLGAVPVHAMPAHRRSELMHLAELSGARAYLTVDTFNGFDHRDLADSLVAARRQAAEPLELVVVVGEAGEHDVHSYTDLLGNEPFAEPGEATASEDLALLLLSGGTTGLPKLIPRTHDDYLYNARCSAAACGMHPDTVFLTPLPIAFNYSWCCPGALSVLEVGGSVVITRDPSPMSCLDLVAAEKVTSLTLNPPLANLFVQEIEEEPDAYDLSSLEVVGVGAARLSDAVAPRVEEAFGATLQQVFGMAEGLICYTALDDSAELRWSTQGVPMSPADEIRVVDTETGRPVAAGEQGELLTRGPYTLRGYYRAPEHNQIGFTEDGFYRTGDVVRQLPSGHLVVVGRVKDHINRGGEKIPAPEVEGHLLAHPGIEQAALVGVPDALLGEKPVAVLRCVGPVLSVKEVAEHLRGRGLAAYKIPDRVEVVETMPLTPVGKIDKAALLAGISEAVDV